MYQLFMGRVSGKAASVRMSLGGFISLVAWLRLLLRVASLSHRLLHVVLKQAENLLYSTFPVEKRVCQAERCMQGAPSRTDTFKSL
jgi:hypothetical protein